MAQVDAMVSAAAGTRRGNGRIVLALGGSILLGMVVGFLVGYQLALPSLILLGIVFGAAPPIWWASHADQLRALRESALPTSARDAAAAGLPLRATEHAASHSDAALGRLSGAARDPGGAPSDVIATPNDRVKLVIVVILLVLGAITAALAFVSPNGAIVMGIIAVLWLAVTLNAMGQLISCSPAGIFARFLPGHGAELRFADVERIGRLVRPPGGTPNGLVLASGERRLHLPELVLTRTEYSAICRRLIVLDCDMTPSAFGALASAVQRSTDEKEIP